jgi:hypothetical protein
LVGSSAAMTQTARTSERPAILEIGFDMQA